MYLAECRRMGIQVLPPDVNESAGPFTPVGKDIRFGLAAVRNVGAQRGRGDRPVPQGEGRRTSDFYDFLSKVDAVACNKKTVESLIKAGAFDSMGHTRKGLLAVHAEAIDAYADVKTQRGGRPVRPVRRVRRRLAARAARPRWPCRPIGDSEWDKRDKLAFEREMLGLYVSDHPLAGLEQLLHNVGRHHDRRAQRGGLGPRRPDRHARRHPHRRAAADHQAGPGLGVGHAGGPGRRGRGAVLPEHLRGDRPVHRRGRHRGRQGPGGPPRRHPADHGDGHVDARRQPQPGQQADHPDHADHPVHAAAGRPSSRRSWSATPATPRCTSTCRTAAAPRSAAWARCGSRRPPR